VRQLILKVSVIATTTKKDKILEKSNVWRKLQKIDFLHQFIRGKIKILYFDAENYKI